MPSFPRPAGHLDDAGLVALRAALTARHAPADAVEEHWVGEIAFALWQQQRLQALAALVLAAAEAGTDEPEPQARAEPDAAPLAADGAPEPQPATATTSRPSARP